MTGYWKYGGKQSVENRAAHSETKIWKNRQSPRPFKGNCRLLHWRRSKRRNLI